ncbi:hypothetical protein XANCAGTX0491_000771 [Xanthoria calcicola]
MAAGPTADYATITASSSPMALAVSRGMSAARTAGIGFACGAEDGWQGSLPVDDEVDPGGRRTSQRAELLAALEGLKYMISID